MKQKQIILIKTIHSIIFFFVVFCVFYLLYCAIARRYDWTLLATLGVILIEGIALLLNHWECPLTSLAKKHGAANGSVTDIFLPMWIARHTFKVSTVILAIEFILLGWGYLNR
jgi:hypothetical protein